MKTIKVIMALIAIMIATGFTSCKKEIIGTPVLTPSSTTVSVNQEVTITLSGVEAPGHGGYSACNTWTKVSGPDFTAISGGGKKDNTWTIKFNGTGTAIIQCNANFCRHGSLNAKTAETTITIQ